MLVHDSVVHLHRAAAEDAAGIAQIHAEAGREQIRLARGRDEEHGLRIEADEASWHRSLALMSGDHRPWVARHGDRLVGFVMAGPCRDSGATTASGEIYDFDVNFVAAGVSGAATLLDHACRDLTHHGFSEVGVWVGSRDEQLRGLLSVGGWRQEPGKRYERVHGVPILQFRYVKKLG